MAVRDGNFWKCVFGALTLGAMGAGCDRDASVAAPPGATQPAATQAAALDDMVLIPGGTFHMGSEGGMPDESPVHEVTLKPYWIDRHDVTVAQFAQFVAATGYKTDAEKWGWSGVFDMKVGDWGKSDGADWHHPDGPQSAAAADEPVVQVSWNDAAAYAKWAGKRLPTEAEFECAARGGLKDKEYAWGDDLRPGGKYMANYWQGHFPDKNTGADGFMSRSPAGSFPANGYGLYDMTGNVWEWCADFYAPDYFKSSPAENPTGPAGGAEHVMRGGSFLCASNFCSNYRIAGRMHATPDSGLNNTGFRCARDANARAK
jgi:sulfatase modifying factor 1